MAINMRSRGLVDNLSDFNFHILGCGAIGSAAATQLVRMGATNFCLYDNDKVDKLVKKIKYAVFDIENADQYKAKLEMLKESYFPQKEVAQSEDDVTETISTSEELNEEIENVQTQSRDSQMQSYLNMLNNKNNI